MKLLVLISSFLMTALCLAEPIQPVFQGTFSQGGVIRGYLPPDSAPSLGEQKLEQNAQGYFVMGFGRDHADTAIFSWQGTDGKRKEKSLSIAKRDYKTQYIEGVPQETVTPPASRLKRIREEAALVKKARRVMSTQSAFLDDFIVPVEGRITGGYGSQRVYNGVPKRPHFGIDYAAPMGTPVVAPADAVISLVHKDMYYSGGTLVMDHGLGLSSTFIHLSEILVKEGQRVQKGEVVAKVGKSGRSTGPHLDWRLNWFQTRLDPALILGLEALDEEPDIAN